MSSSREKLTTALKMSHSWAQLPTQKPNLYTLYIFYKKVKRKVFPYTGLGGP
jgi:hypothetical protein